MTRARTRGAVVTQCTYSFGPPTLCRMVQLRHRPGSGEWQAPGNLTAYVIAIAIFALLKAGQRAGWAVVNYTQTTTQADHVTYGLFWLAIAGGAIWVLLT